MDSSLEPDQYGAWQEELRAREGRRKSDVDNASPDRHHRPVVLLGRIGWHLPTLSPGRSLSHE